MVKAVIFDVDGTLIDSVDFHARAWRDAFGEFGHDIDLATIRGQIGKGGDLLVPALLPDIDEAAAKRISEQHGALFKEIYLDGIRAFADATAMIERVHATGRRVVLASSAKQEELAHYVALLGVETLLAATTSIDDVGASKPEPDIFGVALDKIGVAPSRALVVGDTIYDVDAARRAGVAAVGVASGPFDADRLKEAGAIAVFADVAALLHDFDRSPLAR